MSLHSEISEHITLKLGGVWSLWGFSNWADASSIASFVASVLAGILSALLIGDFVYRRVWGKPRK